VDGSVVVVYTETTSKSYHFWFLLGIFQRLWFVGTSFLVLSMSLQWRRDDGVVHGQQLRGSSIRRSHLYNSSLYTSLHL
jgi:hypothetical protein